MKKPWSSGNFQSSCLSIPSFFIAFSPSMWLPQMVKIQGYKSSDDPAFLSPRTKTLFSWESHLPNEVMKLEASLPPRSPVGVCLRARLPSLAVLPWLWIQFPGTWLLIWIKKLVVLFQCPSEACPLDLFFLFAVKNTWQYWFKSQHFCLFGIFAYSFLAFLSHVFQPWG